MRAPVIPEREGEAHPKAVANPSPPKDAGCKSIEALGSSNVPYEQEGVVSSIQLLDLTGSGNSKYKRSISIDDIRIPIYESSTCEELEGEGLAAELPDRGELPSYDEPNIAPPAPADPPGY